MAAPTIPPSNSQAVLTVQAGGTIPFAQAWYSFFSALLAYVSTGPIGPVPLVGVIDGSSAAAGNVGEYLKSIVTNASPVTVLNDVAKTITSLTLTAGDWDMWGEVQFGQAVSAGTLDIVQGAIWPTGNSVSPPTYPQDGASAASFASISCRTTTTSQGLALPMVTVNITTSVTFFLSAFADLSTASIPVWGAIRARRRR